MIVIADTAPLNDLVLIGEQELLPALFGQIIIPEAVCRELLTAATPLVVRQWLSTHISSTQAFACRLLLSVSFLPVMRNAPLAERRKQTPPITRETDRHATPGPLSAPAPGQYD